MPQQEQPFLTVGMPTFDDYDGVFFTVQALRMYHADCMDQVEILVIDNNPRGPHGKSVRQLLSNHNVPNGRYLAEDNWKGPWVKDLVMREARGKYVMCLDCHILLIPGALRQLIEFYKNKDRHWDRKPVPNTPHPQDFFQGPLVYDNLSSVSTHFEPNWRGEMWGTWATDQRGLEPTANPFEIPMQGMGLFTCAKQSWEAVGGFNRLMKGFGGEEGYIHAKFRQAGRRCWCLPFLRWMHRFNRPHGVPFQLIWENKVWNYAIGFTELGLDARPMVEHFVSTKGEAMRSKIMQILRDAQEAYHTQQRERAAATRDENCPLTAEQFRTQMATWMGQSNLLPNRVIIPEKFFPAIRDWGPGDRPRPDVPENVKRLFGLDVTWVEHDLPQPTFCYDEDVTYQPASTENSYHVVIGTSQ